MEINNSQLTMSRIQEKLIVSFQVRGTRHVLGGQAQPEPQIQFPQTQGRAAREGNEEGREDAPSNSIPKHRKHQSPPLHLRRKETPHSEDRPERDGREVYVVYFGEEGAGGYWGEGGDC